MPRYALLVEIAPEFSILGTPPTALIGSSYSYAFSAQGGDSPIVWSTPTSLPSGWALNSSGVLSHASPVAGVGSFSFKLRATDVSMVTVERTFTIQKANPLP